MHMNSALLLCRTVATFALLLINAGAIAADKPGSKDHPMVTRYQGSEILSYYTRAYDKALLPKTTVKKKDAKKVEPEAFLALEGKLTRIGYRAPEDRSVLEVFRNYEQALRTGGFEVLFSCENEKCGDGLNEAISTSDTEMYMVLSLHDEDQRYLLAKKARGEGDVYVSLLVDRAYSLGGPDKDRIFMSLSVLEAAPMQKNMVKVDSAAMAKGIDAQGHVALYEIFFDTDKADLKPQSTVALEEIAKLMSSRPDLKVLIVGHTDNVGTLEHNRDLSERRAKSVTQTLTAKHGVAADRMTALGVGMAAPLANNESEDGRAKNRRVELVKR